MCHASGSMLTPRHITAVPYCRGSALMDVLSLEVYRELRLRDVGVAYEAYAATMDRVKGFAVQRHTMTLEEFTDVALDPRVHKHLIRDTEAAGINGLGMITN